MGDRYIATLKRWGQGTMKLINHFRLMKLLPSNAPDAVVAWLSGFRSVLSSAYADRDLRMQFWRFDVALSTMRSLDGFVDINRLLDLIDLERAQEISWQCIAEGLHGLRENWLIRLRRTEIPRLSCTLLSTDRLSGDERNARDARLCTAIFSSEVADEVSMGPRFDLQGPVHGVYCLEKLRCIRWAFPKPASSHFVASASAVLPLYNAVREQRIHFGNEIVCLPDQTKSIRRLLSDIDARLLRGWEPEQFSRYLVPLNVSLANWLKSRPRLFFKGGSRIR